MAKKVYKKVGLRKDKNFSDLSNSTESLNNLLDTLVDNPQSTFISEDLDAIRGSYALGLRSDDYREIIDSSAKFSGQDGASQEFLPRITYQNRLDIFRAFSGEPRLFGGNGLTAKYYSREQVFENTANIFSGIPFKIDNFWEQGNFYYNTKIAPESVDVNGGVEWEGFFIPTENGFHTINIDSSSGFTFDFQTEGYVSGIGTYTEIARVGISTTLLGSGSANTDLITLSNPTNTKFIGIGLSVSASGITTGSIVSDYNKSTGVISLTPPTGINTSVYDNFSGNITFFRTVGQSARISHTTYNLNQYQRYRIKFRYYIPQEIDAVSVPRYIDLDLYPPNSAPTYRFRYNYLYSLDYDFSDSQSGELIKFINTSINFGGGTIGGTNNSNDYTAVKTTKKIDISYQPKTSVSSIIKSTKTASTSSGLNNISISDTSNIEVGNFVFGTGIQDRTTVKEISINSSIFLDKPATSSNTGSYTFVDHRGFVKRAVGSSSGSTFTFSSGNTNLLKTGMIMIGSGVLAYTGITTSSSTTTITISPSQTIGAGTTVYFYESKGLINNSLSEFCVPAQTKCLIVTTNTPAGSTVIPVSDSTGVGNGWAVQGSQFDSGTIVNGSPTSPTSITINKPTTKNLIAGSNFTVTSASEDKTLCCPPTDTSPPFNPTIQGLETVSDAPSLRIESGDISFDSLRANILSSNITSYSTSDTSRNRISIQTPTVQVGTSQTTIFKILCA